MNQEEWQSLYYQFKKQCLVLSNHKQELLNYLWTPNEKGQEVGNTVWSDNYCSATNNLSSKLSSTMKLIAELINSTNDDAEALDALQTSLQDCQKLRSKLAESDLPAFWLSLKGIKSHRDDFLRELWRTLDDGVTLVERTQYEQNNQCKI